MCEFNRIRIFKVEGVTLEQLVQQGGGFGEVVYILIWDMIFVLIVCG